MIDESDLLAEVSAFASASRLRLCVKSEFGFVSPSMYQPPLSHRLIATSTHHCITVSLYHDTNAKPSTHHDTNAKPRPSASCRTPSSRSGRDLALD